MHKIEMTKKRKKGRKEKSKVIMRKQIAQTCNMIWQQMKANAVPFEKHHVTALYT